MFINVKNALRNPGEAFKAEGSLEYEPVELMGRLVFDGPAVFEGEICSNGEGVVLTGRVRANVKMNCNRCDREFIMPVNAKVSQMYYLDSAPEHEYVLRDGPVDTFRRAGAGKHFDGNTNTAAVQRGLQRLMRRMRPRPQPRGLRLLKNR